MPGTLTAGRSADREPRGEDDPDVHTQLFIQAGADDLPAGQDRRRRVSRARPARPVPRTRPLNRETPLPALTGGVVTPTARFYVRNHSPAPRLDPASWQLEVSGLVDRPLRVSLRELHHMPAETLAATLECAGNGRAGFDPPAEGEQWQLGAVSTAEWTGVPLAEVLGRAGLQPEHWRSCSAARARAPPGTPPI